MNIIAHECSEKILITHAGIMIHKKFLLLLENVASIKTAVTEIIGDVPKIVKRAKKETSKIEKMNNAKKIATPIITV